MMKPCLSIRLVYLFICLIMASSAFATLPAEWTSIDIGKPGVAGSADYAAPKMTVKSSGKDVWDASDQFRFVYQPLNGDGTIIARIVSQDGYNAWCKVGLMIRETLDADSANVFNCLTTRNGVTLQQRPTSKAPTTRAGADIGTAPYYLKLTRTGDVFTGYSSVDGVKWAQIGDPITVKMAARAYIGLAVTNPYGDTLNTAVFDTISVTSSGATTTTTVDTNKKVSPDDFQYLSREFMPNGTIALRFKGEKATQTPDEVNAFIFQPITGDGTIVVRVVRQGGVNDLDRSGVMIRETLETDAANIFACITGKNGVSLQQRTKKGGATSTFNVKSVSAPVWLKLERKGDTITAYSSPDNKTWTKIGDPSTIKMATNIYIGIAVTSKETGSNDPIIFDNYAFTGTKVTGTVPPTAVDNAQWGTSIDIGNPITAGSASFTADNVTVNGSGDNIWKLHDAFQYVYKPLKGNTTLIVHVVSQKSNNNFASGGLMIRETLDADAAHFSVFSTNRKGITMLGRSKKGANGLAFAAGKRVDAPYWLKVTRAGDVFTGYSSADGKAWDQIDQPVTIPMAADVYVGLAVCSHDINTPNTVIFDNYSITGTRTTCTSTCRCQSNRTVGNEPGCR
ncbi:MAG: hypothetical protein WCJ56_06600 [bacterium]